MNFPRLALLALASLAFVAAGCQHANPAPATFSPTAAGAAAPAPAEPATPETAYLFGWGDVPFEIAKPRGGSSRGAPVTFAPAQPLPLPAIAAASSDFERDRAAILALAGDYKVGFHFLETLGLAPDHTLAKPYHSWATEQVRVLEDRGTFISLQHTLVMFFAQPDGSISTPMLTKHWRQDWTYEDADLHTYRGDRTWARRRPAPAETAGAWSQAVFQVDDSPRYEALGRWEHRGNLSSWTSERAWRPLPRREHTVRDDYTVMEGRHRIVLTPTGWVHEQRNWKRVAGESAGEPPRFLAQEWGLDRYERIAAPSLAAADDYWEKTAPYWAAVRRAWSEELERRDRFTLRAKVDGRRLFEEHFAYAEKLESGSPLDLADAQRHARDTVKRFLAP